MGRTFVVYFTDGTKEKFYNVDDCEVDYDQNALYLTVGNHRIIFNWEHVRYVADEDVVRYSDV